METAYSSNVAVLECKSVITDLDKNEINGEYFIQREDGGLLFFYFEEKSDFLHVFNIFSVLL